MNPELNKISQSVYNDLISYKTFKKGWDGYDGEEFDPLLVEQVRGIAAAIFSVFNSLNVQPDGAWTGACSDGSIDLELEIENRELILTFYKGRRTIGCYQNQTGVYQSEIELDYTAFDLLEVLRWFIGPHHMLVA